MASGDRQLAVPCLCGRISSHDAGMTPTRGKVPAYFFSRLKSIFAAYTPCGADAG